MQISNGRVRAGRWGVEVKGRKRRSSMHSVHRRCCGVWPRLTHERQAATTGPASTSDGSGWLIGTITFDLGQLKFIRSLDQGGEEDHTEGCSAGTDKRAGGHFPLGNRMSAP